MKAFRVDKVGKQYILIGPGGDVWCRSKWRKIIRAKCREFNDIWAVAMHYRSQEQKRQRVMDVLKDTVGTNREIARLADVSHTFVATVREETALDTAKESEQ